MTTADETPVRQAIRVLEDNALTFEGIAGWSWMDVTAKDAFMNRARRCIATASTLRDAHRTAAVPTVDEIIAEAGARFNLLPEQVLGVGLNQTHTHTLARSVAALRLKETLGLSDRAIGRALHISQQSASISIRRGFALAHRGQPTTGSSQGVRLIGSM